MHNGGDASRQYQDAITAQMGERITNLGRRQSDLENEMRSGFRQIEQSIATIANETRTSIASLSQNLAERNRPQWQAIGVALTFAVVIGGMAYWPIREATSGLASSMSRIEERMVTRQEMDWRQARSQEDRLRTDGSVADLRAQQVPRAELDRVFEAYDSQLRDKQRQIDEVKAAQAGIYGARDAMLDLRERLDRLERSRITQPR